jgi:integrase
MGTHNSLIYPEHLSGKKLNIFTPMRKKGVTKYGSEHATNVMGPAELTIEEQNQFRALSSLGLAKKTWSSYSTAERMLAKCCKEKGLKFEFPVPETVIIKFVLWLAYDRNLSSNSINTYLAGIRQAHLNKGIAAPVIRSERVNLLLKGKANADLSKKKEDKQQRRQPITPDLLKLIKARINDLQLLLVDKRMLWTVTALLFFGALRGKEILRSSVLEFDPQFVLCSQDICILNERSEMKLQLKIKAPKESKKGEDTIVDIFQADPAICPVSAFAKWRALNPVWEWDQPAFRWSSGKPLTPANVNTVLKECLDGYVQGADRWFTTHSFRSGAASMMAVMGYSDTDIKAMGRWSSKAFEAYIKLPRTKRMDMARTFAKMKCN